MEQAKLLSMTAVLTVLIWITADSLVNEDASVAVSFELIPPQAHPNMLVEAVPYEGRYEILLAGPRNIIDQILEHAPLTIPLQFPYHQTGLATGDLLELLKVQWRDYPKVSILAVTPPTLEALVDHLIEAEVAIILGPVAVPCDTKPQVSSSSITVRLRESVFTQRTRGGRPLEINITSDVERILKEQPAGRNVTFPIALDHRGFDSNAVLSPASVNVTAEVTVQRNTAEIPTVPIKLALSFAALERSFRAVAADGNTLVAQTITVVGPTEAVARLVRGETRAFGIIQLNQADLTELGVTKLVVPEFHLPPGIELAEDPKPVEFILLEKD